MPTRQIEPEAWKPFLEEFSRRHQGALVAIETADPDAGPKEEIRPLPFVGIYYSTKGSDAGSIEIIAGDESPITHFIARPRHVYHKQAAGLISDEINKDEILEITSADPPPITRLRFLRNHQPQ